MDITGALILLMFLTGSAAAWIGRANRDRAWELFALSGGTLGLYVQLSEGRNAIFPISMLCLAMTGALVNSIKKSRRLRAEEAEGHRQ